ncbi:helix-turn-helix transcriptional regulator [Streptomyces sp. NPDC046985]|uniref:helix-turn-helix transcriptional regulator n=1 Tax=Streptomyces sp. NPDC046985 TaxID=3155377 RepID=UPI00340B9FFF
MSGAQLIKCFISALKARRAMKELHLKSENRDEALEYVQKLFDTRFSPVSTEGEFHFDHSRMDCEGWTLDDLQFEGGGFASEPYGTVTVCRVRTGGIEIASRQVERQYSAGAVFVMADAHEAHTTRWFDSSCTLVRIPVTHLEKVAERCHLEERDFALLSREPVSTTAARKWLDVVRFSQRLHMDYAGSDVTRMAFGDLIAALTLETFPNTAVPESADVRVRDDAPRVLTRALEFMYLNADTPIHVGDVARFSCVSRRTLEMMFRDNMNSTPAGYLRECRLRRIRQELAEAQPGDGTTVTRVAGRYGFSSMSRLAGYYHDTFGELPRETLRRQES